MSLPHALLGLLQYKPATGYELKQTFTRSIHFFWNATLPQIYRTLGDMEGKGWLTVTVEHQDGKPSRKVYQVTESGKDEFRRWLGEPLEVPQLRVPMLIKVFFGNQMKRDEFVEHLHRWRQYHAQLLERYEKEAMPIIEHYARASGAFEDARYWTLTLDFGRRQAKTVIEWCDAALATLQKAKGRKHRKTS